MMKTLSFMSLDEIKDTKPQREHGDLSELKDSIDRFGLMQPLVITPSGSLVAGRRRFQALMDMGIKSTPVSIVNLPDDPNDISRIEAAIDENRVRKNLTPAEEVLVIKMLDEAKRKLLGSQPRGKHRSSSLSEDDGNQVSPDGTWSLEKTANTAGISLGKASQDLKLAEEILEHSEEHPSLLAAETKKQLENEIAKIHYSERREQAAQTTPPKGKYRIIYADPPWEYAQIIEKYGPAERHYPTLKTEEICGIPVSDLSDKDAVLFLWSTVPKLEEALVVASSWGFTYKTHFIWDKVKHNYGHYSSVRHELLLLCTKGSCTPDTKELHDSVVSIERTNEHSEKPAYFRELIEKLYTHGNRIELFARTKTKGWESWGYEC